MKKVMKTTSSSGVRLCPTCRTGYIFSPDLHPRCETCLGAPHAGKALTSDASCPFCARLPSKELQRRADAFLAFEVDGEGDGSWADRRDTVDALEPLEEGVFDGHESDDSSPPNDDSLTGFPSSPLGGLDLETGIDAFPLRLSQSPERPGAPPQRSSPLPQVAPPSTTKALFMDLPEIIKRAADQRGIALPAEPPAPSRGLLSGDLYSQEPPSKRAPLWPRFTELRPFVEEALSQPGKLRAPVSRYAPFTRVHGDTEAGFPSVPPLEQSLASILLPKATFFGHRKPTPPSPQDQVCAQVTDRSHQCAAQGLAAQNNIALLASAVSAMATNPEALPPELATEIGKAMTAILTLTTATTVALSRIQAWQTVAQRNIWLHMSQLPTEVRRELLYGPIAPDGLFGPRLQTATSHLHQAAEEAERLRQLGSWKAAPQQQRHRSTNRHKRKRPTASAAAAPSQASTSALPHAPPQRQPPPDRQASRGRRTMKAAPTWSNPPPEPPTKQRRRWQ